MPSSPDTKHDSMEVDKIEGIAASSTSGISESNPRRPTSILHLPRELRDEVYDYLFEEIKLIRGKLIAQGIARVPRYTKIVESL